jgi:hypothetical protein
MCPSVNGGPPPEDLVIHSVNGDPTHTRDPSRKGCEAESYKATSITATASMVQVAQVVQLVQKM